MSFTIASLLKKGSFTSIYKGENIQDKIQIIIKVFPSNVDIKELNKKVEVLKNCFSPFIVRCNGIYKANNEFWVIFEYCNGGSLKQYICNGKKLKESEIRDIMACCLLGLIYLHSMNIIHNNVNPTNLLLSGQGIGKLADFGLSTPSEQSMMYNAPEVFENKTCVKSDIWSLGITAIELATGVNPYSTVPQNVDALHDAICNKALPSLQSPELSSDFIDFVKQCLIKDVNKRASSATLLNDAFVCDAVKRIQSRNMSKLLFQLISDYENDDNKDSDCNIEEEDNSYIQNKNISMSSTKQVTEMSTISNEDNTLIMKESEDFYKHCIKEWNLSIYSNLEIIKVGNNCFGYLNRMLFDTLPKLESISFGDNSFKECKKLTIIKCNCLKEITIGNKSFQNCMVTKVKDCIRLSSIVLGSEVFEGNVNMDNILILQNLPELHEMKGRIKVFYNVKMVTIENVPNVQNVELPAAFSSINGISITNGGMFESIPVLKKQLNINITVHNGNEWKQLILLVAELIIESNCCNEEDLTVVDFSQFKNLKSVKIGDNCFMHAKEVIINNIPYLKVIEIGVNSFTEHKNSYGQRDAHFICTNNPQLHFLTIDRYSFSDFSECKLENCPSLPCVTIDCSSIQSTVFGMGIMNNKSYNFYYADFQLSNLPKLEAITLGNFCFAHSVHTVIENLPQLKQIKLGIGALSGKDDDNCSLTMRNLPHLTNLTTVFCSFAYPRSVILDNIPNVSHVDLHNAFEHVTSHIIHNVHYALANLIPIITINEEDMNIKEVNTNCCCCIY